jgi:hypothetical protein
VNGPDTAPLEAIAVSALVLATLFFIPWLALMRIVALRQARSGTMTPAAARTMLEKLSTGLLILGLANLWAGLPFTHVHAVAPRIVALAAFPVACVAVAAAAAMLVLAKRIE